jgi:hypothetical protein
MSIRPELGRRTAALLCLSALALEGCYTSVPVSPTSATPSGDVQVELTPTGATSLVSSLGPRATKLEGRISSRSDSSLAMIVTRVSRTGGTEEDWPSDHVSVPMSAVSTVRTRKLSVGRSIAFASVSAVALFILGRSLSNNEGSGQSSGGGTHSGQ